MGASEPVDDGTAPRDRLHESPNLGHQIRYLRLLRKLPQRALARRAGVGVPYISRIENGREQPSVEVLGLIAAALGVTLEGLVALTDRCPTCGQRPRATRASFLDRVLT